MQTITLDGITSQLFEFPAPAKPHFIGPAPTRQEHELITKFKQMHELPLVFLSPTGDELPMLRAANGDVYVHGHPTQLALALRGLIVVSSDTRGSSAIDPLFAQWGQMPDNATSFNRDAKAYWIFVNHTYRAVELKLSDGLVNYSIAIYDDFSRSTLSLDKADWVHLADIQRPPSWLRESLMRFAVKTL